MAKVVGLVLSMDNCGVLFCCVRYEFMEKAIVCCGRCEFECIMRAIQTKKQSVQVTLLYAEGNLVGVRGECTR